MKYTGEERRSRIYLKDIIGVDDRRKHEYFDREKRFSSGARPSGHCDFSRPRPFHESLQFAWHGLVYAFRTERNMRIHAVCAVLALLTGAVMRFTTIEMAFLFLVISMVLLLEMVNTALEMTLDHTHGTEYHPLVKIIKDVVAGGVLLAAITAVIVGGILLFRHLL